MSPLCVTPNGGALNSYLYIGNPEVVFDIKNVVYSGVRKGLAFAKFAVFSQGSAVAFSPIANCE